MVKITTTDIQPHELAHNQKVRELGPECVVLLKNEGVLPLGRIKNIALYGSGARRTIKGGTGSGDVNVRHFVTIEEGLENAGITITSKSWLDAYDQIVADSKKAFNAGLMKKAEELGVNPMLIAMGAAMPEPEYELPLDAKGTTAVYVLSRISGEGSDRKPVAGDIDLTETEIRDILALNQKYKKFVLVLNVGGMVNLKPVSDVKSILLLGQLGSATGDACADILLGKAYPSGKLTMTWAPIDQYPSTEGFGDPDDTAYTEGIYVGYRYFDTAGVTPTYPFGYGLSYTDFEITPKAFFADADEVKVTVTVKNTGNAKGKEVVQVYYSAPKGYLAKPYQELGGYAKTKELAPGEEEDVTVTFFTEQFGSYSESLAGYQIEAGDYLVRVGNSSRNTTVCGVVYIPQGRVIKQYKNICPVTGLEELSLPTPEQEDVDPSVPVYLVDANNIASEYISYSGEPTEIPAGDPVDWNFVKSGEKSLDEFIAGLSEGELYSLAIGNYDKSSKSEDISVIGNACTTVAGGAGETTGHLKDLNLDVLSMCDGPAGIRVSTKYVEENGALRSLDSPLAPDMLEMMGPDAEKMIAQLLTVSEDAVVNYQYCTAIPIGTALAQSFNDEVCSACGDLVGEEMELFGVALWLAPALNIQRSPLCGRNFEYYSEDPLVSGKVAAAITNGVQSHRGCGTTIKHFAANNQETNRYCSNSIISERAFREIYLKGFEICIKTSAPEALMTSYNLINGEHTCNSHDLLTAVLRDEWGYQGLVMTDWLVTTKVMFNPASKHSEASAAGCVKAGNNVTMPGMASDAADMAAALSDQTHAYHLTKAELQANAKAVLTSVLKLSLKQ